MTEHGTSEATRTPLANASGDPFLRPIEDPADPVLKEAYAKYREWLGRVVTPIKVHSSRLPPAFFQFYQNAGELDRQLVVPADLARLIRYRVAMLNDCEFCMDASRATLTAAGVDPRKVDEVEHYGAGPHFSEKERAALDYAMEMTQKKQVERKTFDRLAQHFSEREICEIVYLVASEHLNNLTNRGLNIGSDGMCERLGTQKPATPATA